MDNLPKEILQELLSAESKGAQRKPAAAQPQAADHWASAVLLERAAYLSKLAKNGNGSAGETLREYAGHCAMLSFRSRDGEAEVHESFADVFFILEGRATLVTGGTVSGAASIGPGEIRGRSLVGGRRQELRAGDVAHVPAGLPHQMLVAGETTVTSLVMKIEEAERPR
ncbi:MAG: cupin domain-containing protein [Terracidiphilus sp.]|jgi:mannose-6-phosphate isomerase-like protein (cupin superfamily)